MEDKELVQLFKDGNLGVFDILVERHKKRIYFFALRLTQNHHEAEDISQETFIRAYNGLNKFRGECALLSWLFTIATNCYKSSKRKHYLSVVEDIDMQSIEKQYENAEKALVSKETDKILKNAINRLPEKQRMVLLLRTFEEFDYKKISEIMGISIDSVKANLSYARQTLRNQLGEMVYGL